MPPRSPTVAQQLNRVACPTIPPGKDNLRRPGDLWSPRRAMAGWLVKPFSDAERSSAGGGGIARLEAVLFLTREPLSTRKLSQYANLADATEARTLIRQLNEYYDKRGRAFRVEEVAGGFQLLTRPKFANWLRRLEAVPKETRLSAPGLETLAVVAYRQPASRAEVEAVRGVNCGEILRQLMDRDLVRIAGRSDDLGRPYLYATTKRFLQLFGLRSLDELPRAAQLCKQDSDTRVATNENVIEGPERSEEDSHVTASIRAELSPEELKKLRVGNLSLIAPRAVDEEDDLEDDDELEDEDEDLEDDEFDDIDDDEVDDEDDDLEDDDFEDDEWEEVEDEEEEEEDWDDDDDDEDWDEEEEEEDEEWE